MTSSAVALSFENEDLKNDRREAVFRIPWVDSLFLRLVYDSRDLVMVHLLANVLLVIVPSAVALFLLPSGCLRTVAGIVYLLVLFVFFLQRFVLYLHYSEHRPVYRNPVLSQLTPMLLSDLFGIPSGMYFPHHLIMHHTENNFFPYDISSTMPYQRDSVLDFAHYWVKFVLAAWWELPYVLWFRGQHGMAAQTAVSCTMYWTTVALSASMNLEATLFTFILPFVVTSFALMAGNWGQHCFVDPNEWGSNFKLTVNCISATDNKYSFQDGYHVIHHRFQRRHWSELPQQFMESMAEYAAHDTLVFKDVGFFDIWWYAMSGQLGKLAEYYVHYGQTAVPRTKDEIVAEFRRRLVPIHTPHGTDPVAEALAAKKEKRGAGAQE